MTVKSFVEFWNKHGYAVRVRTVMGTVTWCFTGTKHTFFIPSSAIVDVAEAIAKQ